MPDRISVSSAEFIRNIGLWQNEALRHPISITHHGRERLVLATPDRLHALHLGDGAVQQQADLAHLRAEHAAVLENLTHGFLVVTPEMKVSSANAVIESFCGRVREDIVGREIYEALPAPLASIVADRLQRVMRSRKCETFECSAFDGRHLAVRVFGYGDGAAVLCENTTEYFIQERRLEECAALEAAVSHHPRAAAIKLDARARIEGVDTMFCEWSGFSQADVVGHRFVDLVSAIQRREAGELIERVLRDRIVLEIALTLMGKKGGEVGCILAVAPISTDCVAHGALAVCVAASAQDKVERAA